MDSTRRALGWDSPEDLMRQPDDGVLGCTCGTVDRRIARRASGEPGHRQRRRSKAEADDHPAAPLGWRNGASGCI